MTRETKQGLFNWIVFVLVASVLVWRIWHSWGKVTNFGCDLFAGTLIWLFYCAFFSVYLDGKEA